MESEFLGIEKDYQNIFIHKILEFANINELNEIMAIYEVSMPLYISSNIYDDCLLILCQEEMTILCLNECNKMAKIKYINMKSIIMSSIANEIILSYLNYPSSKNQLLIKCNQ